jgi:hypothetical protein
VDGPRVDPDGALSPRALFSFEKWYFDAQTADGSFVFAYLAPMILAGKRSAELVVCLFPAGGEALRRTHSFAGSEIEIAPDRAAARFPGGELTLDADGARLRFTLDDAQVDLRYFEPADPWTATEAGVVHRRGSRALRWIVPLPGARVEGHVSVAETEVAFDNFGYSDFVQTDIPPWSLPLRELLWGRALGHQGIVVWNRVGVAAESGVTPMTYALVETATTPRRALSDIDARARDWVAHDPTGDRYPAELTLRMTGDGGAPVVVDLAETRLNLADRVADVQRFRTGLERWIYRTATGDPVEYKLLSRVTLDGQPFNGWAAHEWIRWGRGRGSEASI